MVKPLVERPFLREKRLSNAQGRGLCEANAGHAPRGMVCCGRGIVRILHPAPQDDRLWSVSQSSRNNLILRLQLYETDYSCMLNSSCMKRHKAVIGANTRNTSCDSVNVAPVVAWYCILDCKELVKINIYLQSSLRYLIPCLIRQVLYGLYWDYHI